MLILTTHCKGRPGFGNCELLLNKMSEERSLSGRLQGKCANTALSCDSLCRSLHYRQICLDRDLKLYFRVIYYFTLLGVTAGSWWKGLHCLFLLPLCLFALPVPLHELCWWCGSRKEKDSASWSDGKLSSSEFDRSWVLCQAGELNGVTW